MGQLQQRRLRDHRKQLRSLSEQTRPTKREIYRQTGVQHAGSAGFASAVMCSGARGPSEGGGEGSEAVRSRVPEGCRLHLRRLPLEEILQ